MKLSITLFAVFCCIYSGLAFGIYWIPIRRLGEVGYNDIWSVVIFSVFPLIFISPVMAKRWRSYFPGRFRFHICCFMAGLGFALYVGSYLYTEVVHSIVLYYLLPIWGFLFARFFIGEPITAVRWSSMILALVGLYVLLQPENGIPIPSNLGDWMALSGGMIWAGVALLLYTDKPDPINYSIGFIFWGAMASLCLAIITSITGLVEYPKWLNITSELYWLIPFSILVIIPAAFATMYGPSQLSPGVAGLLFMMEISVGTVTAALLSGEPFGQREVTGVLLITIAGILEPILMIWQSLTKSAQDEEPLKS